MLGDASEAEDVTQETFLRAWKALPGWEPRAKFSTWLHRVALNLCYDRLRKRREVTMEILPERTDPAAALTLCALQGHTQSEAADIMDVSVEALESLLARARRTLRASLLERAAS